MKSISNKPIFKLIPNFTIRRYLRKECSNKCSNAKENQLTRTVSVCYLKCSTRTSNHSNIETQYDSRQTKWCYLFLTNIWSLSQIATLFTLMVNKENSIWLPFSKYCNSFKSNRDTIIVYLNSESY